MTLDDPLTGGDCHDRLDLAGVKVKLVDVPRQSFDVVAVAVLREDLQVLGLPLAFLASLQCIQALIYSPGGNLSLSKNPFEF